MNHAVATIDFNRLKEGRVNPHIFGAFVEDMYDHMDAMLAYVARNMDFAEEDENGDGVSGSWFPIDQTSQVTYNLEPAAPKHSGHSQVISISGQEPVHAGIGQRIHIRSQADCSVKLFARATESITQVSVEIVDADTQDVIGRTIIPLSGHSWAEYTGELTVVRDCSTAELRLMIQHQTSKGGSYTNGKIWIDHCSLLPHDRVGVVKKEVFDLTEQLNCGILRFGGNEISGYHWNEGIGPLYERPDRKSEAWGHWTNKYFGTDEFITFCQDLSVEPLICVNAGSGTAEEAARWVKYCNGRVKYWEIGNEIYGDWQIGHCTAEEYGNRFLQFVRAMKAVDPTIIVMGCGSVNQEWNEKVLAIAGAEMDFLTLHFYHRYKAIGILEEATDEEKFQALVCAPEILREILLATAGQIKRSDNYSHVKIALTEYNIFYSHSKPGIPGNHTLEAAITNALILHEIIRNSDMVTIANYSDLVNGWEGGSIRVSDEYYHLLYGKTAGWTGGNPAVYGTPTYHVLKQYANRKLTHFIECDVYCDTFDVIMGEMYKEFEHHPVVRPLYQFAKAAKLDEIPVIDLVACMNEEKDMLTILVVNRGLTPANLTLNMVNFNNTFANRSIHVIASSSVADINDAAQPLRISTLIDSQETDSIYDLTVYAHSIYAIEFFN